MTYKLAFLDSAVKEWRKLDGTTRSAFKKKLAERCELPRVPSAQLSGSRDRYKIKLRGVGYRLVYEVRDTEIVIVVIAIGRRDRDEVYKTADRRPQTADRRPQSGEGRKLVPRSGREQQTVGW